MARQRNTLFDCLKKQRKLALRLGKVNRERDWTIKPQLTKKLLRSRDALNHLPEALQPDASGNITITLTREQYQPLLEARDVLQSLDAGSIALGLKQKGVDMRIGTDIACIALKKLADTIILVAGDSDFVPAAKLARREGIDFILDPLWQQINQDLFEHIDGLQSGLSRPGQPGKLGKQSRVSGKMRVEEPSVVYE